MTTAEPQPRQVGTLLRGWRQRRRVSQLELALDTGVSTRHLSFVETGRSRPSAEMVLALAEQLEVPLRERNDLLLAAGYAPRYAARELDAPELAEVRDAVNHVLAGHEPYPAVAVDRYWTLIASNSALDALLAGVADELLVPPVNTLRLALHPRGMAPRVLNLGEWRADLLHRVQRAAHRTADAELEALHDEVLGYPGPAEPLAADTPPGVMVPLRLASPPSVDWPVLSFFSTISTFGTAVDVTVSELAIEAFFPADPATAAFLRGQAEAG